MIMVTDLQVNNAEWPLETTLDDSAEAS